MSLAMKFFEPDPTYLDALAGLARVGAGKPAYLAEGVRQLIARARTAPEISQRNRLMIDALSLLNGTWERSREPDLFDPAALQKEISALAQAKGAPEGVLEAAQQVQETTWTSFVEFAASPEGQRQFDPEQPDSVREYLDWFRLYKPYLVLGIPDDEERAEAEVRRRIEWMVGKLAPSVAEDPSSLRDPVRDMAWDFARQRFFQARSVKEDDTLKTAA